MAKKYFPGVLLFVATLMIAATFARAVAIDFYGIDANVQDTVSAKLTVTFDSKISSFRLPIGKLTQPLRIQKVSANKGIADCRIAVEEGKANIDCKIQDPPEGRNTLTLFVEPLDEIDVVGDKNIVNINYEFPFDTKSLSVSYNLPERAALSEEPVQNSISPRNGDIKTDGKKIFIFWNRQNITAGDILTFSASYTLPEQRESPINTLLIIPIILILAILVWFVIRSRQKSHQASETAAVSVLSKDEKVLFDILKIRGGSANQKMLVRESNFSKAKVSRLLKDLKERGVIEIEPISGRENKILLNLGKPKEEKKQQQPTQQQDPEANKKE